MKKSLLLCLAAFFLLLPVFFSFNKLGYGNVLIIKEAKNGRETVLPVPNGCFTLKYIHSVHKTPVYEIYELSPDNKMLLQETRFYSLGVGMPFSQDEGVFTNKEGEFRITGLKREFTQLPLLISPLAQHAIIIEGRSYQLSGPEKTGKKDVQIVITSSQRLYIGK